MNKLIAGRIRLFFHLADFNERSIAQNHSFVNTLYGTPSRVTLLFR